MTLRFTDDVGYIPTVSILKADAAYIAAGKWRCPKSPIGAHRSVNGVCRDCGAKR